jgi:hypothetical protein
MKEKTMPEVPSGTVRDTGANAGAVLIGRVQGSDGVAAGRSLPIGPTLARLRAVFV